MLALNDFGKLGADFDKIISLMLRKGDVDATHETVQAGFDKQKNHNEWNKPMMKQTVLFCAIVSFSLGANSSTDTAWIKMLDGKHTSDFMKDSRSKELISSSVAADKCDGKTVATEVTESLGGPGETISVTEGRFVTIQGCRKHACNEISMVWVDLKSGKSAVAFTNLSGGPIYVTSKDFASDKAPNEFKEGINTWLRPIEWNKDRPPVLFCKSNVTAANWNLKAAL